MEEISLGRKQLVCFGSLERRSGRSFDLAQRSRFDPKRSSRIVTI